MMQSPRVQSYPGSGCAGTSLPGPATVDSWSEYADDAGDRRCRYFRCRTVPTVTSSATNETASGQWLDDAYLPHIAPLQTHLHAVDTYCQQWFKVYPKKALSTTELTTARCHMMPPPLHLSDIRCKCVAHTMQRCHSKQKSVMNDRTTEGVYVGCWRILCKSLILWMKNNNLHVAIANRSRVSCAHNIIFFCLCQHISLCRWYPANCTVSLCVTNFIRCMRKGIDVSWHADKYQKICMHSHWCTL